MRAALLALALAAIPAGVAGAAEPLATDLSSRTIAVTTRFAGTDIVLFGTREEPGDIIVIVRGPPRDLVVRRAHRVLGIWINTEGVAFEDTPAFYSIAASRPPETLLPRSLLAQEQIGLDHITPATLRDAALAPMREYEFRSALLRHEEAAGRYGRAVVNVTFEGEHLFRANIPFPSSLPLGDYTVETLLVRDGAIVARQRLPLHAVEAGVNAGISDFARNEALAYGVIAVAAAAMAGWLGTLVFRVG